jgi:hypothetical protein
MVLNASGTPREGTRGWQSAPVSCIVGDNRVAGAGMPHTGGAPNGEGADEE